VDVEDARAGAAPLIDETVILDILTPAAEIIKGAGVWPEFVATI
jgi:hypothetical protein